MEGDFIRESASLISTIGSVRVLVLVAGTAGASRCSGTIAVEVVEVIEGDEVIEVDWLSTDLLRLKILMPPSDVLTLSNPSTHTAGGVPVRLAAGGGVAAPDTAD